VKRAFFIAVTINVFAQTVVAYASGLATQKSNTSYSCSSNANQLSSYQS